MQIEFPAKRPQPRVLNPVQRYVFLLKAFKDIMNCRAIILSAAIAFTLAACDSSHETESAIDPAVAQQLLVARIDPDQALAEKVERALGIETGSLPYGVEVTAADGKVQLWGTVDSTAVRKRLGLTAAGVVGVKALENRLQVDPGA